MKYFNSILPFFIAIAIIFLLTSCGALPKTQQWIEGEFQYYKINEKDTILDYSTNQSLAIPVIASSVNHLHFYLTEINKHFDYTHRNWTEKRLRNLHKEYQSMNNVTFARVERLNDSFYLPSNSVNKVTCRYFTYDDELDKIIPEFKRVLKPNGDLIIIQRVIEDEDYLKLVSNYPKPNPLPKKNL